MRPGSFLPPFDSRRRASLLPGTTLLVPLLAATLMLALYLGYQAVDAVRSHRDAAESALRDYGSMAAWQYAGIASDRLDEFFEAVFDDVPWRRRDRTRMPVEVLDSVSAELADLRCTCPDLRRPSFLFHVDLESGAVAGWAGTTPPGALTWLADTLMTHHVALARHRFAMLAVPDGALLPEAAFVFYAVGRGPADETLAYGFVTPAPALGELFGRWFETGLLLPPAITGATPNDSLLHVAVRGTAQAPVFESAVAYPTTLAAFDTLDHEYGPLVVVASVRPDAASQLIIGGLPSSKLPLILGLLVLTLGVGGAALFQIRRERLLARLRDDFISGVSHELRTPLAQIRMFAELQESGRLRTDEERVRATTVIHREARRLTHLVDNILRFSRLRRALSSGLIREEIDVTTAVGDIIEGFRPLAVAGHMSIQWHVERGLAIIANADALNQMLLNLLDNALKYGPPGQCIRLDVSRRGDTAVFAVDDEGPGIPAHDRSRIWTPYFRLDRDRESRKPGTGIGLAVVAQLADLHGGRVRAETAAGGGARFLLELPAAPAPAEPADIAVPAEVRA